MSRLVTLMTCQWTDMDLETLCQKAKAWGYDGLELACWGKHLDAVKAAESDSYCAEVKGILEKYDMQIKALSTHIIGQCVGDLPDPRLNNFAPPALADKPDEIHEWAVETMKASAYAAKNLGACVVTSFTGSPIWRYLYSFPQTPQKMIDEGYQKVYREWTPILDEFVKNGIKYALEEHPAEIAFDYYTTQKTLETFKDRPEFGINFDPSHLIWQGVTPHIFLKDFGERIYHVHMKDAAVTLDGRTGLLGSHIDFGSSKRGWNFRSLGHGDVNFEEIIRTLNEIGYEGPLSVEWDDSGMEREYGAKEACEFVKKVDFAPSTFKFDDAISNK